jgi:transaldolase
MIKISATAEGIPAIEQCLYEGININITLLFSISSYEATMEAYIRGLERRLDEGKSVTGIASVASFFVSRIDTAVDKQLQEAIKQAASASDQQSLKSLIGRIAIANAKIAYQRYKEVFHGARFARLRAAGAQVQRPLWASTSTKNPAYRDVMYVEELVGPDTVNTMPRETADATDDHGVIRGDTLLEDIDGAQAIFQKFEEAGVSYDEVVEVLEKEGVEKFEKSFADLIEGLESKLKSLVAA